MFNNNGYSLSDIAAATGNNNGGFGFDGNGGVWMLILFIILIIGGGWSNGGFGNGGGTNYITSDVQRGFDQSAVISGLAGINASINSGFANAEVSRCNSQANILQTLNNNQANLSTQLNTIAMNQQNCCCENRAGLADLKYTVATEACADRTAIASALKDVIASNTANTQAILDKMCQQEIDALKTQNANLQTQLNLANLAASQTAQTARLLQDNAAQTATLENYLNPPAIPAYIVQNPNCCGQQWSGCGCGNVM